MRFSDKQYWAATFGEREGMYYVLVGPIRSGKSVSGLRGFLHWAGTHFSGHDFCLAAKSSKQWQSVILSALRQFAADNELTLTRRDEFWELESDDGQVNRFYRVVGGEGGTSAARLEGMTFAGAYIDDAAFLPEILLDTIMDRCSVCGAKVVMSCYPQNPHHALKLRYVNPIEAGEMPGEVIQFGLADNPSLSSEYIRMLCDRWRGQPHEFARRIEGRWTAASGLIYGNFHLHQQRRMPADVEATIYAWEVCADWASSSVTHALLLGRAPDGRVWVADEWRHDGRYDGELLTEHQADAMVARLSDSGKRSIRSWVVDPSADGLMLALRDRVKGEVVPGVADVDEGLRVTGRWVEQGRFVFVTSGVPALLQELGSYIWDEKAAAHGVDKPAKDSADGAHGCDALRYYAHTREEHEASYQSAGVA